MKVLCKKCNEWRTITTKSRFCDVCGSSYGSLGMDTPFLWEQKDKGERFYNRYVNNLASWTLVSWIILGFLYGGIKDFFGFNMMFFMVALFITMGIFCLYFIIIPPFIIKRRKKLFPAVFNNENVQI